jgi:gamma-glutamyltranspeptidase/glutathione hydrolase
LTSTVNLDFGADLTAGDTGIVLNDEMDDFAAAPGAHNAFDLVHSTANAIAPNKRPLSSMAPTIVLGPEGPILVTGSAGGPRIISSVLQVILGVLDFGLDPSAAVGLPRVHHQWEPDVLKLEHEIPNDVCGALRARGHAIERYEAVGRAHAIVVRREGGRRWLEAASDPRSEGTPAGD